MRAAARSGWTALAVYVAVTIVAPALHRAPARNGFAEHVAIVLLGCAPFGLLVWIIQRRGDPSASRAGRGGGSGTGS